MIANEPAFRPYIRRYEQNHRVLTDYIAYDMRSRTHLALGKDAPIKRPVSPPSAGRMSAHHKSAACITVTTASRNSTHEDSYRTRS